jgi:ParB family chromosome partitioning protein
MKNKALGRGLSSLLREEIVPIEVTNNNNMVDINDIEIGNLQPRKRFDESKIKELADSIVSNGLIQPIVVNKDLSGKYKIIAGERRYRACQLLGMRQVPVIIKNLSDKEILAMAIIENIQREELTAIEEAEGFDRLMKQFGYNQVDLATAVGKSRSHVANILRLNQLPDSVKFLVNEGQLTMGHARCLIGLPDAEELAVKIVANGLNVRQAEDLAKRRELRTPKQPASDNFETSNNSGDDFIMLGHSLSEKFGVKVVVENSWNGGKVTFHYSNLEELDSILTKLN